MRHFLPLYLVCAAALLSQCDGKDTEKTDSSDPDDTSFAELEPDAEISDSELEEESADVPEEETVVECNEGTRWQPGTQAFREATAEWGLDAIGAQGVRLNAVDFDGDGWTDLIARFHGVEPDSFEEEGTRRTWLLRNTGQGTFEDVTEASYFRATRHFYDTALGRPGEVIAFADVDNDGDLDAYTGLDTTNESYTMNETSELMLNLGNGTFIFTEDDNPLRCVGRQDVPAGAAFTDFDRDGFIDLWVPQSLPGGGMRPLQDRLWKGDGTGRFSEVTEQYGAASLPWTTADLNAGLAHSWAWSAAACDLNGDGLPELLATSYGRYPNLLWESTGSPAEGIRFVNRGVASHYAYDHRMDWTDNWSARCYCKLRPTAEDCEGVPEPDPIMECDTLDDVFRWNHLTDREPYRLGGNSGSTICGDVDNDGDIDLLTTEIAHWDVGSSSDPAELLFNTGEAQVVFERPGNDVTGLTREHGAYWDDGDMSGAILDFDNDGWPDVYIGSSDYYGCRGLLYHQDTPGHFEAVSVEDGFLHNRSHGVVHADFDRDGDLDMIVGHSRARCSPPYDTDCYDTWRVRFFENVLGDAGNWIQLRLEGGAGTNRAAIGARVTVAAGGVTQTQEVGGGFGHFGAQNDLVLHFGLADACEASVTIRWPDESLTTQELVLAANKRYHVAQGEVPIEAP